jgi:hypothetical protein
MLAQSFMTASELGITEPQRMALQKTLVLLETGKLVHTKLPLLFKFNAEKYSGHFNMGGWRRETECGSVCCIGGTAELIGNVRFNERAPALETLFYPSSDGTKLQNYESITAEQAARALRSYLTTGDAKWSDAVS